MNKFFKYLSLGIIGVVVSLSLFNVNTVSAETNTQTECFNDFDKFLPPNHYYYDTIENLTGWYNDNNVKIPFDNNNIKLYDFIIKSSTAYNETSLNLNLEVMIKTILKGKYDYDDYDENNINDIILKYQQVAFDMDNGTSEWTIFGESSRNQLKDDFCPEGGVSIINDEVILNNPEKCNTKNSIINCLDDNCTNAPECKVYGYDINGVIESWNIDYNDNNTQHIPDKVKITINPVREEIKILTKDPCWMSKGGITVELLYATLNPNPAIPATPANYKILPPLTFFFEKTIKEGQEIKYQITKIEEALTGVKVNILELKKLQQASTLSIFKGGTTVDGSMECDGIENVNNYNPPTIKGRLYTTDIKKDLIDLEIFNTHISSNEVYDARGGGISKIGEGKIKGVIETDSSDELISRLLNFILSFVAAIAIFMFIYAGYLYITARGDDAFINKAQSIVINAVIGIALIIGAYTITNTILSLPGGIQDEIRIDFKLGSSTLVGATLPRDACIYTGTVTGAVKICNEDSMLIVKTPLANTSWPIEEVKGICKRISIFSVCIDDEI